MRQFVYETEDEENTETGIKRLTADEMFDSKIVYRKQRPLNILNKLPKVRTVNIKLKRTTVCHIIRFVSICMWFSHNVCSLVLCACLASIKKQKRLAMYIR